MQFTTVRSKKKDYDIYLKSEKLVHQKMPVGARKKCFPAIWKWKKLVPSYFEPDKHCCSYLEREKSGSLLFGDQKMQFTTVRSKEKDYDIYLKSEKLVHSQQEHEKNVSQLFGSGTNWFLAISSLTNTVAAAIWREKKVDPCYLEDQKMLQFTTVRSKEKDYDIYLKSEKLVHSQQEHEKNVSQLFGSGKNWFLAISSLTNTVAAIWREKKVDPCYLETKKCSSQQLGARKKIMTSI